MNKKNIKVIGNIASIIAIVFLVYKIFNIDLDLSNLNRKKTIIVLVVSSFVWTLSNIIACYPWLKYIEILTGKKVSVKKTQIIYLKSNILKYIPGNIFQYIGRNRIAIDEGFSHIDIAVATVLEQVSAIMMLFIYSLLLVNRGLLNYFTINSLKTIIIVACSICIVFFSISLLAKKTKKLQVISNTVRKIAAKNNLKSLSSILVFYIFVDLIGPINYYVILKYMFNVNIETDSLLFIIGIYLFSVLVGLITPGAPGGIGVREVVMISLSNGVLNESIVVLIAVLFRVITIIADIISFAYAMLLERIEKKNEKS